MRRSLIAGLATAAIAFAAAGAASAAQQVYNLSDFAAGFTGSPLGTVTVTDNNTNTLSIDVVLNSDIYFQMTGNGDAHDDFWFDLPTYNTTLTSYNVSSPDSNPGTSAGDFPVGGAFTLANFNNNHYGQGFLQGFDYAIQGSDSSAGGNTNYYTGHLTFTITGSSPLSIASLGTGQLIDGQHVFFGADLRQCVGNPNDGGTCAVTGPVGAVLAGGVPEPAAWALMIMGFGGIGAVVRRRKASVVAATA